MKKHRHSASLPSASGVLDGFAGNVASSVLMASLILPGMAALVARDAAAETAPEKSTIGLKYGSYQDSQPGLDRIKVSSPQLYVQVPVAGVWAIEGSATGDSVSGASSRMHTERSSASQMNDYRKAAGMKLTRYLSRATVSASVSYSTEHDYTSRGLGLEASWSTDDNNRTLTVGYGTASDRIDNTSNGTNTVIDRHKHTHELMVGVTQVLTPTDIAQLNLTRSLGAGYFDDPYKFLDQRPDRRNAWIALARLNHYVTQFDAALRGNYRYYTDTFGIRSHTLGLEWEQPFGRWSITPGARYYSQSAANFYLDPVLDTTGQYDVGATLASGIDVAGARSFDARLGAFGAITLSGKISYRVTPDTVIDAKFDNYQQAARLHLGSAGSPNLDRFRANFLQLGLTHRF
jgi:hypothetical protein